MKRLITTLLLILCLMDFTCGAAHARLKAAKAKPAGIKISADKPASIKITWYVKGKHTPQELVHVTMREGNFYLGDRKGAFLELLPEEKVQEMHVESDGTYLMSFKETLSVSRELIDRAVEAEKDLYFERAFHDHTLDVPVLAHILIRPESMLQNDLSVENVGVSFIDKPGLCMAKTGQDLFAETSVKIAGRGMLHGQWEIRKAPYLDEFRVLKAIHIPVKKRVEFLNLSSPALPTELRGPIDVRFVVTEPSGDFKTPFVSCLIFGVNDQVLKATEENGEALHVLAPEAFAPFELHTRVKWETDREYGFYRVLFLREDGGLVSAMDAPQGVREIEITPEILKTLDPQGRYQVRVLGHR